jgi:hypothetical protein
VKNTSRTHKFLHPPNTGGHRRIQDLLPLKIHGSYTNRWISGPLSHKHLTGGETLKEKMKMEEVREMGAPSSYLTGLSHNPSFAPGYK